MLCYDARTTRTTYSYKKYRKQHADNHELHKYIFQNTKWSVLYPGRG